MTLSASTNFVASGQVKASAGIFVGCNLTGGSDAATLIVYDNTAGSGTILCKLAAAAGVSVTFFPCAPVRANTGMYATLTGTAPSATVVWR